MDVVALHKGKFGRMRSRGDTFTIDNKQQFSKRWMAKAGTPEAKAAQLDARDGKTLTAAQIEAEMAEALGKAKSPTAALKAKDARIAELEATIAKLEAALAEAPAEAPAEAAAEAPAEAAAEAPAEAAAPTRRSRRA